MSYVNKRCAVCDTTMRPTTFMAMGDHESGLLSLPAIECGRCGKLMPDADKIASMPPGKVPSSLRIRCAKILSRG
jgi:hypothetical protein